MVLFAMESEKSSKQATTISDVTGQKSFCLLSTQRHPHLYHPEGQQPVGLFWIGCQSDAAFAE